MLYVELSGGGKLSQFDLSQVLRFENDRIEMVTDQLKGNQKRGWIVDNGDRSELHS
jgi:hypothetical protein